MPNQGATQRDAPRAVHDRPQDHRDGESQSDGPEGEWRDSNDAANEKPQEPVDEGLSSGGSLGSFAHVTFRNRPVLPQ
jgi:hypothetical protein